MTLDDGFLSQHVRDTCRFDLECPIRGVGPGIVRKLLLEENLKIRGRKDNKVSKARRGEERREAPACGDNHERRLQLFFIVSRVLAAGGGGSALLGCSPHDQSPQERGAAEGGPPSAGPGQNTLHCTERWLWVTFPHILHEKNLSKNAKYR